MANTLRQSLPGALAIGAGAVVFAVLGLTPGLTWIPEVPLIAAGLLYPVVVCGVTSYRAAAGGRLVIGVHAGAIVGAPGGVVGGLCYVLYGKPAVNVLAGLLAGLVGGGAIGAAAAVIALRRAGGGAAATPRPRS